MSPVIPIQTFPLTPFNRSIAHNHTSVCIIVPANQVWVITCYSATNFDQHNMPSPPSASTGIKSIDFNATFTRPQEFHSSSFKSQDLIFRDMDVNAAREEEVRSSVLQIKTMPEKLHTILVNWWRARVYAESLHIVTV